MMYRIGTTAAIVILAIVLWFAWIAKNGSETPAAEIESTAVKDSADESAPKSVQAMSARPLDHEIGDGAQASDDAAGLFGRVSPADVEGAVHQRLAEQSGLKLVSLNAVDCDLRSCTVIFSGLDPNPSDTGDFSDLLTALTGPQWKDFRSTSSSIGTREVSPGAREYVLGFTYVALVKASDDPDTLARQHAACAGAWARVTEQRGSDDYLRGAQEESDEWLELSAGVIGMQEAIRLADELRYGPLTRDCHATPY